MSSKVQSGGMFNSYRVNYSPETHNLLKVLMDEVKISTALRAKVKETMSRGEPLPIFRRRRARPSYVDENLFDLKKNYYFLRRSHDQIIHSGAYDRDRYRCLERTVDLEKEKERLRNIMEFGKHAGKPLTERGAKPKAKQETFAGKRKDITPEERLEELIQEIEDRVEFLKDMEILGKAKEYEATIKQEIAAKLREMKNMDKSAAKKYSEVFGPPKKSKTTNNVFR